MEAAVKAKALLDGQRRILEMVNEDRPLEDTLEELCKVVEAQSEGMLTSVLLLDEAGQHLLHGAAPSLPADYNKAIHGISIGNGVGSCGTAAATGEPCVVEDIATHPNWAAFKGLAHETFGLAACWSTPVRAYDGRVVATFAIYHRVPKKPTLAERKLIDFSTHLVAIAVNRRDEIAALRALG
ncbi:MAG TPA: GAF domain-containing protein [Kofleriaceae bacterium]|nr:GAF domain-containing protein [Kofleriaceae bacterium]